MSKNENLKFIEEFLKNDYSSMIQNIQEETKSDSIFRQKVDETLNQLQGLYKNTNNSNFLNEKNKKKLEMACVDANDTISYVNDIYQKKTIPSDLSQKIICIIDTRAKIIDKLNENKIKCLTKKIEDLEKSSKKSLDEITASYQNSVDSIMLKLDGMWGNVLTVILSFSVVATLITAIEKIDVSYILLFSLIVVWFGMTLAIFFGNLFKKEYATNKQSVGLYIIISVLLVFVIGLSIFYSINRGYLTDYVKPIETKTAN